MSSRSFHPRWSACILSGVLLTSVTTARGDFVKPNGPLPLTMPGTLGLSMETLDGGTKLARMRSSGGSCSAAAIQVPAVGLRVVTAKHCVGRRLELFDEAHRVAVRARHDAGGDTDVTLLELAGEVPWKGLAVRGAETLVPGERLCAWKVERDGENVVRQQVCGRFLRRASRDVGPPLLIVRHPFPHGTSGSALVDARGRAVGVVVATQQETGIAEPIEAAIELASSGR